MTSFLTKYKEAAVGSLEVLARRPLTGEELGALDLLVERRFADRDVTISNPHTGKRLKVTLARVAEWAPARTLSTGGAAPAIWTGHGTLFKPHGEFHSILGDMVSLLLSERGVAKKKMFKLIGEGRPEGDPEVKALDAEQKIWKLLANSFYGAYGEKGFHFYDPAMGPAVTYTGQQVIAATLWSFEAFMSGNLWMEGPDELAKHVASCLELGRGGDPGVEWGAMEQPGGTRMTPEGIAGLLSSQCSPGWDSSSAALALAEGMTREDMWAVALRGNPFAFCEFPEANDLLFTALGGEIKEADGGAMAKHHPDGKAALDRLWVGMRRWVMAPWFPSDLPRRVARMKRRTVTLTDTDSTFLALSPWMKFAGKHFDLSGASSAENLTVLNCMVYLLGLCSADVCAELTKNLGVPEEKRRILHFKSEFVVKRMIMTEGKKNYAALLTHQEGVELPGGGKVEIKGLVMKKTTIAKDTGAFFTKSVEQRLLRPEDLDRVGLLRDVIELEARVRESLAAGRTEFSTPFVLGRVEEYVSPFAMPVVRGMMAWNCAEPNSPIRAGDRVNMFRSKIGSNAGKLGDEIARWPEGSEEFDKLRLLTVEFFGAAAPPELSGPGINWIAVPKDVTQAPPWVTALIDAEAAVLANTAPILPILEAVGVRALRLPSPETFSSTIKF